MNKNPEYDKDPGYIFFNTKVAYDKYQTAKLLGDTKNAGYFAARCRMFIKEIDLMGLVPTEQAVADEMKIIREAMDKDKGPGQIDMKENPRRRKFRRNNGELPPYEPFAPKQGEPGFGIVIEGPKQVRLYRIIQLKHALKIEAKGMKFRGGSVGAMVKREFGLTGTKATLAEKFDKIAAQILSGHIPLPGYQEAPNAWWQNRPPAPPATEHPFGTMQNNPPIEKRLTLRELQQYDQLHGESEVRALEMMVDSGNSSGVSMQFWKDVMVYGVREAYLYLRSYARQGDWKGNLGPVKDQVNKMLTQNGRTRLLTMQDNPSEPQFEPDPFRDDDRGGPPPDNRQNDIFEMLFKLARDWREAIEADDQKMSDNLAQDIKYTIDIIEGRRLRPSPEKADKYEKVYAFFMADQREYGNNPDSEDDEDVAPVDHATHATKPFTVKGKQLKPVRFRTLNAAVMFARERAQDAKIAGITDVITVVHWNTGNVVAKFDTMGPKFEDIRIRDTQTKSGSTAQPGQGMIRKKPFSENPWLIAGPNLQVVDDRGGQPTEQPLALPAGPHDAKIVENDSHLIPIPASERRNIGERRGEGERRTRVKEHKGDKPSKEIHKLRSKVARRQKRDKHGKFYDNPTYPTGNTQFIKVYEFEKGKNTFAGYFRFDAAKGLATIRATETKNGMSRGFELDIDADDYNASALYNTLCRKGFEYIAKKLMKSKSVRAKRAYERAISTVISPISGPWGGPV